MATIVHTCGGECNALTDHTNETIVGAPSLQTTYKRSGAKGIRITNTASSNRVAFAITPTTVGVFHGYLYFVTLPAATQAIITKALQTSGADDLVIAYNQSTNKLQIVVPAVGGAVSMAGTVEAGRWYRIDIRMNVSANPWVVSWSIDGVAQTGYSPATAAATVIGTALGHNASSTFDIVWDDVAISATSADYPIADGSVGTSLPETYTPAVAYVSDTFTRSVTDGWGSADNGLAWAVTSQGVVGDFDVASGVGTHTTTAASRNTRAWLPGVSALDQEITGTLAIDKIPVGASVFAKIMARGSGTTLATLSQYNLSIGLTTSGQVTGNVSKHIAGTETALSTAINVPGLIVAANDVIKYRFLLLGASPTQLAIKLWTGATEPDSWFQVIVDSDANLQDAGFAGLGTFTGAISNVPIVYKFDDFVVAVPTRGATIAADDFSDTQVDTWAAADIGGTWGYSGAAAGYDITAGAGLLAVPGSSGVLGASVPVSVVDVDAYARFSVPTTGANVGVGIVARATDATLATCYYGGVWFESDNSITAFLHERAAGSHIENAFVLNQGTYSANQWWWVRFQIIGTDQRVKVWPDGSPEPAAWNVTDTDATLTAAGRVGIIGRSGASAGAQSPKVDDFSAAPGGMIALDDFSDTIADSMGTADIGGAYTESGTQADYDKAGGVGTIAVVASGIHFSYLDDLEAQDFDLRVRTRIDAIPVGASVFSWLTARGIGSTDNYTTQLEWRTTGGIRGGIIRRIGGTGSGGTLVALDDVAFGSLTFIANDWVWMRMQVQGVSPTTIRFKIWKDGTVEPSSWQQTITDGTSPLQATGHVGFGNNAGSALTGTRITSFDDYLVVAVAPPSGTQYTQGFTAALTFVGVIPAFRITQHSLTAALTFVGAETDRLARTLTGALGFATGLSRVANRAIPGTASLGFSSVFDAAKQVGAVVFPQALGGAVSFAGATSRSTSRTMAGALTFVGAQTDRTARALAGSLTFVGATVKRFPRPLAAALTFVGATVKRYPRPLSAGLTFVGSAVKRIATAESAALSFVGAAFKRFPRPLAGSLTFSAAIASTRTLVRTLTAGLTFVGTESLRTGKALGGSLTFAGAETLRSSRTFAASVVFAGSEALRTSRSLAASFTPAAAIARRTSPKAILAALTYAGGVVGNKIAGAQNYVQPLAAALTFVGASAKRTMLPRAGFVTFAGAIAKRGAPAFVPAALNFTATVSKRGLHPIAAALTFAGSSSRQLGRSLAASLTFAGAIPKRLARTTGAALTFAASSSRQARRSIAATLTFSGSEVMRLSRQLTAALTFVGAQTQQKITGAVQYTKSLAGSLTFSGAVATVSVKVRALAGALTFSGAIPKRTTRSLAATLTPAGAMVRRIPLQLAAALTFVGTGTRRVSRSLFGAMSWAGALAPVKITGAIAYQKAVAGALTFAGATSRITQRGLAATFIPAGALLRRSSKALTAALTLGGTVNRRVARPLVATLTLGGSVNRLLARSLSGTLSWAGLIAPVKLVGAIAYTKALAGALSFSAGSSRLVGRTIVASVVMGGAITRRSSRTLAATLTLGGNVARGMRLGLTAALSFIGVLRPNIKGPLTRGLVDGDTYGTTLTTSGSREPGVDSDHSARNTVGGGTRAGAVVEGKAR